MAVPMATAWSRTALRMVMTAEATLTCLPFWSQVLLHPSYGSRTISV